MDAHCCLLEKTKITDINNLVKQTLEYNGKGQTVHKIFKHGNTAAPYCFRQTVTFCNVFFVHSE